MTDVFISYSRKDIDFARRLVEALKAAHQESWIDWQGIPYSADWWAEICAGIDGADTFLCIISPNSLGSRVCNLELEFARTNFKRIVPIIHQAVEGDDHKLLPEIISKWYGEDWEKTARDNWTAMKHLNWLFFRDGDDFDKSFASLVDTAEQDPEQVRQHTRLLVRAKEWDANGRKPAYALRADDLRQAEIWLAASVGKDPAPTVLHQEYISASRTVQAEEDERRRNLSQARFGLVLAVALVAVLGVVFLNLQSTQQTAASATLASQSTQVAHQRDQAQSLAWTGSAQMQWNNGTGDALLALALALRANQVANPPPLAQSLLADIAYTGTPSRLVSGPLDTHARFFSPDTRYVLSTIAEEGFIIWDSDTGAEIHHFPNDSAEEAIFSPDSKFVATFSFFGTQDSDQPTLTLWDVASGEMVWQTPYDDDIYSLTFSPDGRFIAAIPKSALSDDNRIDITVWNVADGKEISRFTALSASSTDAVQSAERVPFRFVTQIAFNPGGQLMVGDAESNAVLFFDVETGKETRRLDWRSDSELELVRPQFANSFAFSPSGHEIFTEESDSIFSWNTDTGVGTGGLRTSGGLQNFYISQDGRWASTLETDGNIMVWNRLNQQAVRQFQFDNMFPDHYVQDIAFTPDGQYARVLTENEIIDWDMRSGAEIAALQPLDAEILDAAFTADGSQVIFSSIEQSIESTDAIAQSAVPPRDRTIMQVWNPTDNTVVPAVLGTTVDLSITAFSPDRQYLLSAGEFGDAILWNMADHTEKELVTGDEWSATSAAFSPDGQRLLIATGNGELILWNVSTGAKVHALAGHTTSIHQIVWSRDGEYAVSAGSKGELILWNMSTGTEARRFAGHSDTVSSAAFSPNGKYIVSGGDFSEIILWDTQGGNVIERLISQGTANADITSVAFSPDGSTVASGGKDGNVLIWDVASRLVIRRFHTTSYNIQRVLFSVDGKSLLAVSPAGLHLWRLDSPGELVDWTLEHRYLRELTCPERVAYQIPPYCDLFPTKPAPNENPAAG